MTSDTQEKDSKGKVLTIFFATPPVGILATLTLAFLVAAHTESMWPVAATVFVGSVATYLVTASWLRAIAKREETAVPAN